MDLAFWSFFCQPKATTNFHPQCQPNTHEILESWSCRPCWGPTWKKSSWKEKLANAQKMCHVFLVIITITIIIIIIRDIDQHQSHNQATKKDQTKDDDHWTFQTWNFTPSKFKWQRWMSSRKPWRHPSCTRGCCLKSRNHGNGKKLGMEHVDLSGLMIPVRINSQHWYWVSWRQAGHHTKCTSYDLSQDALTFTHTILAKIICIYALIV